MRTLLMAVTAVVVGATTFGCAAGFRGVYPGMNAREVTEAMGTGPARVDNFNDGYAGWYYNEDQCVLMKDNVVVSKNVSENRGGINVAGIGGFSVKDRAQCLPPGVAPDPNPSVNVGLPGANIRIRP